MERYPTQEIDMLTPLTIAASEATAAALYTYCTSCDTHEGGAEEMIHTMSLAQIVAEARADGHNLVYWQDADEGLTRHLLVERITE